MSTDAQLSGIERMRVVSDVDEVDDNERHFVAP